MLRVERAWHILQSSVNLLSLSSESKGESGGDMFEGTRRYKIMPRVVGQIKGSECEFKCN